MTGRLFPATLLVVVGMLFTMLKPSHSLAGTVVVWGSNNEGQTDVPPYLTNAVAISAGAYHTLSLKDDGTVVGWGYNDFGQATGLPTLDPPHASSGLVTLNGELLTNVVAVSAGANHSLALRADGTVIEWGGWLLNNGPFLPYPSGLSNVVAIDAGDYHSLALRADGTVVAWGNNYVGQSGVPPTLRNVVAISGGSSEVVGGPSGGGPTSYSLALRADGTVTAWGSGWIWGVTRVPAGLTNVIAIAAGYQSGRALRSDGTVARWGATTNSSGLTNIVAIDAGIGSENTGAYFIALRADGTVVNWASPVGLSNVVSVSAGTSHGAALVGLPPGVAAPQPVGPRLLIGTANENFYHRLMAANGVTSFGAVGLPPGLILDSVTGVITGKPSVLGSFPVMFSATNDVGSVDWTTTLFVNAHPPVLRSQRSGNVVLLSWPAEFSTAILESASALDGSAAWTPVPGSGNPRTVPIGPGNEFFRLRIP